MNHHGLFLTVSDATHGLTLQVASRGEGLSPTRIVLLLSAAGVFVAVARLLVGVAGLFKSVVGLFGTLTATAFGLIRVMVLVAVFAGLLVLSIGADSGLLPDFGGGGSVVAPDQSSEDGGGFGGFDGFGGFGAPDTFDGFGGFAE